MRQAERGAGGSRSWSWCIQTDVQSCHAMCAYPLSAAPKWHGGPVLTTLVHAYVGSLSLHTCCRGATRLQVLAHALKRAALDATASCGMKTSNRCGAMPAFKTCPRAPQCSDQSPGNHRCTVPAPLGPLSSRDAATPAAPPNYPSIHPSCFPASVPPLKIPKQMGVQPLAI